MRRWQLLLVLWGILLSVGGLAQPGAPAGWLPNDALSGLMLRTLVSSADGLLWVGTDDGVYRYDGTRLVSINTLRRGGAALPATGLDAGGLALLGLATLALGARLRRRALASGR